MLHIKDPDNAPPVLTFLRLAARTLRVFVAQWRRAIYLIGKGTAETLFHNTAITLAGGTILCTVAVRPHSHTGFVVVIFDHLGLLVWNAMR